MANQGHQGGNPGQRDENDPNTPTGTSGRQGDNWQQGGDQTNRQTGEAPRRRNTDDEDSPLGNRNMFR